MKVYHGVTNENWENIEETGKFEAGHIGNDCTDNNEDGLWVTTSIEQARTYTKGNGKVLSFEIAEDEMELMDEVEAGEYGNSEDFKDYRIKWEIAEQIDIDYIQIIEHI